jgi:hypothetical protein
MSWMRGRNGEMKKRTGMHCATARGPEYICVFAKYPCVVSCFLI